MKHQVSFGWRPPWWLKKVDWLLQRWCFSIASSGTHFYMGKVQTCEFFKRLCSEMQTSVSGFLSLLEKNHNRVLDYLVSILEKRFLHCLLQSSWGLFYLVKAPFNPVQALLHPVWTLFCPVQTLLKFRPGLFHPGWAFLCWMGSFYKQKGPLTPNAWQGYEMFTL